MGCICSFLKALTSYHGTHLSPEQIQKQRMFRNQKRPPAGPVRELPQPAPSQPSPSSPMMGSRTSLGGSPSTSRPIPSQSPTQLPHRLNARTGHRGSSGTPPMLRRFPSEDQGAGASDQQRFPTFVHRSPQIRHQRSLQVNDMHQLQRQSSLGNNKRVTFNVRNSVKE